MELLNQITERLLSTGEITPAEALRLLNEAPLDGLLEAADRLRLHFAGDRIDTCSIMNARSGRCSENCKWCSQSAHHRAAIEVYPLASPDQVMRHADDNASKGVARFSLVTSGRALSNEETERCAEYYRAIARRHPNLGLCASMGLLDRNQLETLRRAGVTRYHCNLETAPSHFPALCTTHTVEQKLQTLRWARESGMELCSGGILGMGESAEQRLELAFALRDLGVDSIPLNVLNPIPGTPLEGTPPLTHEELLRSFALFRLIHPRAVIRFAGGRTLLPVEVQERALRGGINGAIVGDLLTTLGQSVAEDRALFTRLGFRFD